MLLLSIFGFISAYLTYRITYLPWFQMPAAALITFISSCPGFTVRTNTFHIPIRQELFALAAVCQIDYFWVDIIILNQLIDDIVGSVMVYLVISTPERVEPDIQVLEYFIKMAVIFFNKLLRCCA